MNPSTALRAVQAVIVVFAGAVAANMDKIPDTYDWILAAGIAAVGMAISEILAGFDARAAFEATRARAGAAVKKFTPWWWGIVN